MATRVPETRYRNPGADIWKGAATQYGDGALRRQVFQCLGGAGDEGSGAGIGNDGGQGSVVVEKKNRFSRIQDTDYLTVRLHRIREFRYPSVSPANNHGVQVLSHNVGAGAQ